MGDSRARANAGEEPTNDTLDRLDTAAGYVSDVPRRGSRMGVIADFFGGRRSREAELERAYVQRWIDDGVPESDARKLAKQLFSEARSRLRGSADPTRQTQAGDRLLQEESTNEVVHRNVRRMRDCGARDEDIQSWWNLSDFERCVIQVDDESSRAGVYVQKREKEGVSSEEAAAAVRKAFPIYGSLKDPEDSSGDDRPLTPELHARIDVWIRQRSREDPAALQADVDASTSMNALIRRELRNGRL
jgi:hypothetical protein